MMSKYLFSFLVFSLLGTTALAGHLGHGSNSGSGGNGGGCGGSIPGLGTYIAITTQIAIVINGRVESESHSFSFSGFLQKIDPRQKPTFGNASHVFYHGEDIELAVPYVSHAGLYARTRLQPYWQRLCDY